MIEPPCRGDRVDRAGSGREWPGWTDVAGVAEGLYARDLKRGAVALCDFSLHMRSLHNAYYTNKYTIATKYTILTTVIIAL